MRAVGTSRAHVARCCPHRRRSARIAWSTFGPHGIPLSKIHHAAFDAHLIGIDPDYRLHVSERLLTQRVGPMLEAIKGLNGGLLRLPKRIREHPDRDRLALRFDRFKAAA